MRIGGLARRAVASGLPGAFFHRHGRLKRSLAVLASGLCLAGCAGSTRLSRSEAREFAGRTYVIVGASSGFGRGAAEALGRAHANVVLAARRADLLEEVAAEVRRTGGQALVVPTDVAAADQVEALADAAARRFGRIDVWMNIAGVGAVGQFWDVPVADYSRIIDVNLKGVLYGSHVALRRFIAQGGGILINMGSVESEVPLAYHAVYAATKAGVLSLGRSLNQELRRAGLGRTVKVATIMPWAVDTPFFQHVANYSGHADRMILLDEPQEVVRALLHASLHPPKAWPVGLKARGAVTAHRLLPGLSEHIAADIHGAQLARGSPVAATPGAVHTPMQQGRDVADGVRQRMKAEDRAWKSGAGSTGGRYPTAAPQPRLREPA